MYLAHHGGKYRGQIALICVWKGGGCEGLCSQEQVISALACENELEAFKQEVISLQLGFIRTAQREGFEPLGVYHWIARMVRRRAASRVNALLGRSSTILKNFLVTQILMRGLIKAVFKLTECHPQLAHHSPISKKCIR